MYATFDPRLERLVPVGLNARVEADDPYDLAIALRSDLNYGTSVAVSHNWVMDIDYFDVLADRVIQMHTIGRLREGLRLRSVTDSERAYLARMGVFPR